MTVGKIKKVFNEMLKEILIPEGFLYVLGKESHYTKETPFGYNRIIPSAYHHGIHSFMGIVFTIRINEVNDIINPFSTFLKEYYHDNPTISASISCFGYEESNNIIVDSEKQFSEGLAIVEKVIKNEAADFFRDFTTVAALDKEFNRSNRPQNLYADDYRSRPFLGITTAALNKNPEYKFWEDYYRNFLLNGKPARKLLFEGLSEDIKNRGLI